MVGITEISAIVAASGVLVGVVYYIQTLRHQNKLRQMDFIIRMPSTIASKEYLQTIETLNRAQYIDFDDYDRKYHVEAVQVAFFFENVGLLVKRRLVDIGLVGDIYSVNAGWKMLKPWVEETRRRYNNPKAYEWFEYLYNEMKKRERQLQQRGVENG